MPVLHLALSGHSNRLYRDHYNRLSVRLQHSTRKRCTTTDLVEAEQMQTRNLVRGQEPSIELIPINWLTIVIWAWELPKPTAHLLVTFKVNWSVTNMLSDTCSKTLPTGKYLGDHRIAQTNFTVPRDVSEPLQLFIVHHPSFYGQNRKNAGASCRASSKALGKHKATIVNIPKINEVHAVLVQRQ